MKNILKNLIVSIAAVTFLSAMNGEVFASGQYGETVINKSFRIEKEVRIKDEGSFEDKLILDSADWDEILEFRIKIKNTGELETDDMKMEDFLPSELYRVGGDKLVENWDDFEPGETKTFYIDVKVDSDEFDRENFDKCVVNKAEVRYKGKFEGADTATVCYGVREITELPETGFGETLFPMALGLLAAGFVFKKYKEAQ